MRAYRADFGELARFLGAHSPGVAVDLVIGLGHGGANRAALAWRASMMERGLASATVARRLAALRSLVRLARMIGRIDWTVDIQAPRVTSYRDVTGPGPDGWRAMLRTAVRDAATGSRKGLRNDALVRVLHDRGYAVAKPWGSISGT
jgi:integrase/recombinase XerC